MNPSLRLVHDRFPDLQERAAHLFDLDDDFRDLCDEYAACSEARARLEAAGQERSAMRSEYAALGLRLEHELLRRLEERIEPD